MDCMLKQLIVISVDVLAVMKVGEKRPSHVFRMLELSKFRVIFY